MIIYAEGDKTIGIIAYFDHEKACPVIDTENWLVDNSSVHKGIVFKLLTGTQFFAKFFYKLKKLQKLSNPFWFNKKFFLYKNFQKKSKTWNEVKIAIDRLWVKSSHRRRGIGRELLSAVQKTNQLSKNEICFTDPTEDGSALGNNYFSKFLVAHL